MQNLSFSKMKQFRNIGLTLLGTSLLSLSNAQPAKSFSVTFEAPNTQETSKSDIFVIDFDDTGDPTNEIDAIGGDSVTNAGVTYTYSDIDTSNQYNILPADQYGGADGSGNYIRNDPNFTSRFSISINVDQVYLGMWWSAGDAGNTIEFFKDGTSLFTFDTQDITSLIPNSAGSTITAIDGTTQYNTQNYYGNPTTNFSGQNSTEPYAFINFYAGSGEAFDRVDIYQPDMNGKFESDNHTFSAVGQIPNGTEVAVPFEFSPGLGLLISGGGLLAIKCLKKRALNKSLVIYQTTDKLYS